MNSIIAERPALVVETARTPEDVLAAQRLRYEVFALEMGARRFFGQAEAPCAS
jgi:putative hemolysin